MTKGSTIQKSTGVKRMLASLGGAPKKVAMLGVGVVVAAAIVIIAMLTPAFPGVASSQETPHVTTIPALAAADSDTFVLAPYSRDWWLKVASMASPEMGLVKLDPSAANVAIDNIGYSRGQDHATREVARTGPLRLFYIESATAEAAEKVAEWLRGADGYEGRRVFQEGRVLVVGPSWVNDYSAPSKTMASVPEYSANVTSATGVMWRNVDRDVPSMVGDGKAAQAEVMSTVMSKGFGFTTGTTWIGQSKSGDSWSGAFKTGGVNPAQLDFKAAESTVMATQKVLKKIEFKRTAYTILDDGMTGFLTGASFLAPSQTSGLGGPMPSDVPKVKDAAVTAVIDVTRFNAAASGIDSSQENVSTQAISANEHEMVVSFGFVK